MTTLRPYQETAIANTINEWKSGVRSVLTVAPTGAGKTVIAAELCRRGYKAGRRILFVVTRQELITQTRDKLIALGVDGSAIGIIQGANTETRSAPIQVASLQTLARRKWWKAEFDYHLTIFDEAHESRYFKTAETVVNTRPCKILGLTATPYRLKRNESLSQHFDSLVAVSTPRELQDAGYLVPARYYAAGIEPDTTNVTIRGGDYDADELQQACNTPLLIADALACRDRLAADRPTIAFCAGVVHANDFVAAARLRGITAAVVTGETSAKKRRELYDDLRSGKLKILASVGVLTTGFDEPSVSCVMLLRRTKSLALHEQMIGRGLRLSPATNKTDCLVIDQARNCLDHGTPELIFKYTLDPAESTRDVADAGLRLCPACQNYSQNPHECDACGFVFTKLELAVTGASEANEERNTGRELFGFNELRIARDETDAARDAYRKFRRAAFERHYDFGWAYHRFKEWCEKRGIRVKPKPSWAHDCLTDPDMDLWDRFFLVSMNLERIAKKKGHDLDYVHKSLTLEFAQHDDIIQHLQSDRAA